MKYPESFKQKVKEVYPEDFCGLYKYLDNNSVFVGRILDDSSNNHITNKQIFDYIKNNLDFDYSEDPDDHKSANLIKLDNGNFAIMPNNRITWSDTSFIEPYKEIPKWKANTKIWENSSNNNPKLNLSLVATFKKGQNDLGVKNCLIEAKNNFDKGTKI
jgi:hypothetical protein